MYFTTNSWFKLSNQNAAFRCLTTLANRKAPLFFPSHGIPEIYVYIFSFGQTRILYKLDFLWEMHRYRVYLNHGPYLKILKPLQVISKSSEDLRSESYIYYEANSKDKMFLRLATTSLFLSFSFFPLSLSRQRAVPISPQRFMECYQLAKKCGWVWVSVGECGWVCGVEKKSVKLMHDQYELYRT